MEDVTEPRLDQILEFCGEDPVERVFLEDVARRSLGRFTAYAEDGRLTALCHVGANVVPAGRDCGRFAAAAARGHARMIIGDEKAVGELWERLAERVAPPRDDRPGQPVYAISHPPEPGDTGLRPARSSDFELLLPACAAAHEEEIGVNPLALDPDGFRRSRREGPGCGPTATPSSSRRRRRHGRRRPCRCSRSGSILLRGTGSTRSAACATCVGSCSSESRPSASSSGRRTPRRSGSTRRSGCTGTGPIGA